MNIWPVAPTPDDTVSGCLGAQMSSVRNLKARRVGTGRASQALPLLATRAGSSKRATVILASVLRAWSGP